MPDDEAEPQSDDQPDSDVIPTGDAEPELIALPDQDDEDQPTRTVTIERSSFAGDLPPPELAQGYENILPGFLDRRLRILEQEQAGRLANDQRSFDIAAMDIQHITRRLLIVRLSTSLILIVIALFGFLLAAVADAPEVGGAVISTSLAAIVVQALRSVVQRDRRDDEADDS